MRLRLFLLFAVVVTGFLHPLPSMARNAPITTAGSSIVCPAATTTVPVTVTGFTSVKAITLRLDYDPTQLSFVGFTNLNPGIPGASINNVIVTPTLSKIMIVWAELTALTLVDGSKLVDLNFTLISGSPLISFNNSDNGGGDCEYADENYVAMNDIPTPAYYFNSTITNNSPGPAGTITGASSPCAGASNVVYTVPAIANATSYTWSLPTGGTIISGNNTNTIVVNYAVSALSGNMTVFGSNVCGQGASSTLAITVNSLPGSAGVITGPDTVCAGTNGVVYSTPAIANATSYEWTIPAGAVITSGSTSSQIVVTFSSSPGTGIFMVKGSNECGYGTSSPNFPVAMISSLPAPVVTASGPLLTSSVATGNQWYYEGTGAIAGATGQTYTATITGWYWSVVMGVGCPVIESNHVYVLFTGKEEIRQTGCRVYPVPCDGKFTIALNPAEPGNYTIMVYDMAGVRVFEQDDFHVQGAFEKQVDLQPLASGIYSLVIIGRDHVIVKKILVE